MFDRLKGKRDSDLKSYAEIFLAKLCNISQTILNRKLNLLPKIIITVLPQTFSGDSLSSNCKII